MSTKFYPARFGDIALLVTDLSGASGRDWVVQSPSRGDMHTLQDRGRKLRRASCTVLFCDQPGKEPYLDRYRAFEDAANKGTPLIFTHPLHGSYQAIVESVDYSVNGDSQEISASAVFLAMEVPTAVQAPGAGVSAVAGPESIEVTKDVIDNQAETIGETSTTAADCLAAVESWVAAESPDARSINVEVASLANAIDTEITRLDAITNYERWPLYKSLTLLRYQVSRAASAVTAETSNLVDYAIRTAIPVRALAARIYGATNAAERADEITRVNGLRTPGLIPAGTVLKVPSAGLVRR